MSKFCFQFQWLGLTYMVQWVMPHMSFGTQVVLMEVLEMRWFYMVLNWLSIGLGRQSFSAPRIWAVVLPQFLSYGVWLQLQDMNFTRSNHGLVMLFSLTWLGSAWPLLWITALGNLTPKASKTIKLEKVSFLFLKWLCSVFSKISKKFSFHHDSL